ncbi:hypothetical protein A2V71_04595 [Candidatus Berkelbacteria bacterium RBG_13_40_8]|uniref:DUF2680 domain-containing protein n=1 Tax=Candidatus Berkelbacteria bacterium RBG_13_40_8 TaxID=1797467 RepID=A0A1F5DMN3_9BACT|nr:MAG: hypothetical protein A2V71_04595 [Candidatus Berkelbacteria bacterium RBG_13_40_8]
MLKAKILVPMIALGIIGTGAALWSTGVVKAQGNGNGDTMVTNLAQKLGIDESKVSTAMGEIRTEKRAEMLEKMKTKLEEAVKAGTITDVQKDAILAKQTEMQQKREQERNEYQTWLSDNDLEQNTLQDLGIGMGGMGGGGKGHGPGGMMD